MQDSAHPNIAEPARSHTDEPSTVPTQRAVTRVITLFLVLVAVDLALRMFFPLPTFSPDWRLPRDLPTSQLARFVSHFDKSAAEETRTVVAFVGASPTWGATVDDEHATVPAAFRKVSERESRPTAVYNFASNGQFLGDMYFIAKRVADRSDVLYVQLTYHSFNSSWRQDATSRYPEIPTLLGEPIDANVARTLRVAPSHRFDLTGAVDRWLRRHWYLYGSRDALAASLLGTTPEQALFSRWEMLAFPDFAGDESIVLPDMPFASLDPDLQMRILDEFASAGEYEIDRGDSEVRMLERLALDMEREGVRVIFYVAPLNTEALESFDLFDRESYVKNMDLVRTLCESHGHRFIDFNTEAAIPGSAFADVNHTTAEGSKQVAEELWRLTSDAIEPAQ